MKESAGSASTKIVQGQFSDAYEVSAEIGRGKFAVVKRCTHKSSGTEYAAKFIKKRRKGKDCRSDVLHEVHMLELALSHPHIISLVEVFETVHDLVIVTHFAKGGELFEYIDTEGHLDEKVTVRLMRQILDGIAFLHMNSIAHLDVKPQNILLTEPLPKGDIKLCDFGLARLMNSGHDILEIIGTPDYVAPEVLDYKPLNSACDMWSVGVLTYVMLTGCSPFTGDTSQETYLNISQVNLDFPEDLFGGISKEAINFIESLLLKNPHDRLRACQALDHAWLQRKDSVILMAESPSGQRRNVLAMQNPDFHEPIKKYRCDPDADKENRKQQKPEKSIGCTPSKSDCHTKISSISIDLVKPVSSDCDRLQLSLNQPCTVHAKEEKYDRQDLPGVAV